MWKRIMGVKYNLATGIRQSFSWTAHPVVRVHLQFLQHPIDEQSAPQRTCGGPAKFAGGDKAEWRPTSLQSRCRKMLGKAGWRIILTNHA